MAANISVINQPELIRFDIINSIGWVTLNRPKALNALNHEMILALSLKLDAWKDDPKVKAVVVSGEGERAFCAGGDIKAVYTALISGDKETPKRFFADEYTLNWKIHCYPKPYISILRGIAMGGGLGISVHGTYRIVTEDSILAMPETGIGFFPDVGGTFFLRRCPGQLGVYLGLTGSKIKAADALYAHLATHYLTKDALVKFKHELQTLNWSDPIKDAPVWAKDVHGSTDPKKMIDALLQSHASNPGTGSLERRQGRIDTIFGKKLVREILEELEQHILKNDPWAEECFDELKKKSPTSLAVTHRALKASAALSITEVLKLEYRLSQAFMETSDFLEGVRAVVIEKGSLPNWRPSRIEAVHDDVIDVFFQEPPEGDLILGLD